MRARHGIMGSNTWSATATPRTCLQKDNPIVETDVFRHTRGESISRRVYYFDVPYSLLGNQSFENQLFSIIINNIIYNMENDGRE